MRQFFKKTLTLSNGKAASFYALPELEKAGVGPISRLPISLRVVLESVLRHCDGKVITEHHVKELANWDPKSPSLNEIPFTVARVLLQDFTGVPLLVDLAAMREAVAKLGRDPALVEPLVPVNLVVDHSVQVDVAGKPEAFKENLKLEFERNHERYEFLKWGQSAFQTFKVVPPGVGIVHQVNLEHLASVVFEEERNGERTLYPDSLVGTDSHTTMINGLGVVGWGVGGIEAESGMLGQPIYFQTPSVVGVYMTGELQPGVTATDLTLFVTELLRHAKVVGQFVEFFGPGASQLSVADRSTIANMAPEYGATMGYFPIDEKTLEYLALTGRSKEKVQMVKDYYKAQGLFGIPQAPDLLYTRVLNVDLSAIQPSVAGPKRPQDRIELAHLKGKFTELLHQGVAHGGYAVKDLHAKASVQMPSKECDLHHGSVVIAAITSCTNTSNPAVMVAAGLVAQKAVALGLKVPAYVKTSLAPGSRVVTDYLQAAELDKPLDALGFQLVGYGCTTCIGNSGPLDWAIEEAIVRGELVAASVLSGNRNFEARVHPAVKANFLMSPPLVVAFALAGRIGIDFEKEPVGHTPSGEPVYLKQLWPTREEIDQVIQKVLQPSLFHKRYAEVYRSSQEWDQIKTSEGLLYQWNTASTYIQNPPFFENFSLNADDLPSLNGMQALAMLGDSVTTDHISPAGFIALKSPAGEYLASHGVVLKDFNSYGSRRGNDRVMTRGTFANVRIKNAMAQGKEGGYTLHVPSAEVLPIYDAAMRYKESGKPLILFAGKDYGMGSSRDWAAKGTALLGVKVVVASSFERIHRSNLIGMGVLPLEWISDSPESIELNGTETFSIEGLTLEPHSNATLVVHFPDGNVRRASVKVRLDTLIEVEYYRHGGLLLYVLRDILR
jgi:aconitate hydratase